ncbi:MAG: hypothetical protein FJ403_16270 [Verrucomicrobia bacterium]|nr:hypothetical protein [Verrucomicrobiota bacterium]
MPQPSLIADASGQKRFPVQDYNLTATLTSGQAFRWQCRDGAWEGVIGTRWVRLDSGLDSILAATAEPVENWDWLSDYLQIDVDLAPILAAFPRDDAMRSAVDKCRGLRLLRQDPWECLASFILSSTKQIVQIRQIVELLCERFGERVISLPDRAHAYAFPTAERLAQCDEAELRACKMGFRAPYLKAAANMIACQEVALEKLRELPAGQARDALISIPGVGRKIADCVLLFAYGFQSAFPVDVWVTKALRELYFRRRRIKLKRLQQFSATYFGPFSGYAQQYLFHYMRLHQRSAHNS